MKPGRAQNIEQLACPSAACRKKLRSTDEEIYEPIVATMRCLGCDECAKRRGSWASVADSALEPRVCVRFMWLTCSLSYAERYVIRECPIQDGGGCEEAMKGVRDSRARRKRVRRADLPLARRTSGRVPILRRLPSQSCLRAHHHHVLVVTSKSYVVLVTRLCKVNGDVYACECKCCIISVNLGDEPALD